MSKRPAIAAAASIAVAAIAASTLLAPAHADIAPQAKDVVGVGSDVVQNAVDFLADGYGSTIGYNETKAATKWRLFNFDASGDAAGTTTPNATAVLKNGTSPYNRPKGGSDGLNALIADTKDYIDFARVPSAPTAAQEAAAKATVGNLDWVTLATDTDYIATTKDSNAPSILTPAEVLAIYTGQVKTWGDLASFRSSETLPTGVTLPAWTPAAPSNKIIAFVPQNGAGMLNVFLSGLTKADGTHPVLGDLTNAIQVKQNDPTTLIDPSKAINAATGANAGLSATQAKDVIVPLPQSKYTLFSDGYYLDGSKPYSSAAGSQTTISVANVQLLKGSGAFTATVQFNVVFRDKDLSSKTAWQPGSKTNWVQTLFYNTSAYAKPTYKPTKAQAKKHPKITVPWAFSTQFQGIIKKLGLTPVSYATAFHKYSDAK